MYNATQTPRIYTDRGTEKIQQLLTKLAEDPYDHVRVAVAENQFTPREVLDRLSKDKNFYVRYAAASNPHTPTVVLLELAEDEEADIREAVIRNLNNATYRGVKRSYAVKNEMPPASETPDFNSEKTGDQFNCEYQIKNKLDFQKKLIKLDDKQEVLKDGDSAETSLNPFDSEFQIKNKLDFQKKLIKINSDEDDKEIEAKINEMLNTYGEPANDTGNTEIQSVPKSSENDSSDDDFFFLDEPLENTEPENTSNAVNKKTTKATDKSEKSKNK